LPKGTDRLEQLVAGLTDAMRALGGDHPLPGGGPSSPFANTWRYLKARIPAVSALPDLRFNFILVSLVGTPDGRVNLEAMTPPPLFTVDDDWWFATLASRRDPVSGLTADADPPYSPYLSNSNQDTALDSPFAAELFHNRWYGRACRIR